jgi:hypothetical protein
MIVLIFFWDVLDFFFHRLYSEACCRTRIRFFWDTTLRHWVNGSRRSEAKPWPRLLWSKYPWRREWLSDYSWDVNSESGSSADCFVMSLAS